MSFGRVPAYGVTTNMPALVILIVTIVIISAVVGVIAQFLNKMNEANAPARRPPAARAEGGEARQSDKDMDRFLAEIDRLRKRNQETAGQETAPKPAPKPVLPPVAPVTRPSRQPDRSRPRVIAELAEPQLPSRRRDSTDNPALTTRLERREAADAQEFPAAALTRPQDLPVAAVVAPLAPSAVAVTRVAPLPVRARPTAKTELARHLTALLNSGQGVALAVILQEVLGPPKCKQR